MRSGSIVRARRIKDKLCLQHALNLMEIMLNKLTNTTPYSSVCVSVVDASFRWKQRTHLKREISEDITQFLETSGREAGRCVAGTVFGQVMKNSVLQRRGLRWRPRCYRTRVDESRWDEMGRYPKVLKWGASSFQLTNDISWHRPLRALVSISPFQVRIEMRRHQARGGQGACH